jgi:hypothetical protein
MFQSFHWRFTAHSYRRPGVTEEQDGASKRAGGTCIPPVYMLKDLEALSQMVLTKIVDQTLVVPYIKDSYL